MGAGTRYARNLENVLHDDMNQNNYLLPVCISEWQFLVLWLYLYASIARLYAVVRCLSYTWNIEIFLMWSKCWATKSNKSCMLAKGKQLKHGDVRMNRDSCLVLVCLCEGEWDRTWQKKQSLCACRFDVSASTNKDRVKHCSKQTRTLHTIGWAHKYFWSFFRIMRHTQCCLFWVKQWKFKNNSHHLSFNTNLLFQTFSYW